MNILFSPGIAFLRQLKFAARFVLIGISLFLPLVVTTYFLVEEINLGIEFARKERLGIEYNFALRKFFQSLQQRFAGVAQENTSRENLIANETQIEANVAAMDRTDRELGAPLLATARWNGLKTKWQELKPKGRQQASACIWN